MTAATARIPDHRRARIILDQKPWNSPTVISVWRKPKYIEITAFSKADAIIECCASAWETTISDMLGPRRYISTHAYPRIAAYGLMRKYTALSLKQIADRLCRADHTTVVSGLKRYKSLKDDVEFARRLKHAENLLIKS